MKRISIILPCYNCQNTILDTLNSISNQTYKDFQLIIVNDGSTDFSLKKIKEYCISSDFRCKIIDRENKGFLHSLNEAINNAPTDFIARIDADDLWKSEHLELIMSEFDNDKNLVLIGSQGVLIDAESSVTGRFPKLPESHNDIVKYLHKDCPFIHSSVIFKRAAYSLAGGYLKGDSQRDVHIADYNLWFELSKIGKCRNLAKVTIKYRVLGSSMSRSISLVSNYKARLFTMKKVDNFYNNHKFFSWLSRLKVQIRIFQHYFRHEE